MPHALGFVHHLKSDAAPPELLVTLLTLKQTKPGEARISRKRTFLGSLSRAAIALLVSLFAQTQAAYACSEGPRDLYLALMPPGPRCTVVETFEIAGRNYRVLLFNDFPPVPSNRHVYAVREAVERAAAVFNRSFTTPPAYIYFDSSDGSVGPPPTERGRAFNSRGNGSACVIRITREAVAAAGDFTGDAGGVFKRAVARELFHCVQDADPVMRDSRPVERAQWWRRGSAEYFAGFAIPETPPASEFYAEFSEDIRFAPLYIMGRNAFPFFAFLGRERGPDGVVTLLRSASTGGSPHDQIKMLRTISGIGPLFNLFARRWIDESLTDEHGRPLPIPPGDIPVTPVRRTTEFEADLQPFGFTAVRRVRLAATKVWGLSFQSAGEEVSGAFKAQGAGWRDLPGSFDACEDTVVTVVMTAVDDIAGSVPNSKFTLTERPGVTPRCGACPVGTWTISLDDAQSMVSSRAFRMTSTGETFLTFLENGTAQFTASGMTQESTKSIPGGGSVRSVIKRDLRVSWTWLVENGLLTMNQTVPLKLDEVTTTTVNGAPFGSTTNRARRSVEVPINPASGRPRRYSCSRGVLTIGPPTVAVNGVIRDNDARELNYPHWGRYQGGGH